MVAVLSNDTLRLQLQRSARETALNYTPDKVVAQLEALLYSLAAYSNDLLHFRQMGVRDLQSACVWAAEACSRRPATPPTNQQQVQFQLKQQKLQQ